MDKIAVIPVRSGSKRLPKKNYKSFNSRNIVEIARDKCLAAGIFDKVIISSDDLFLKVAKQAHARDITFNTMVHTIIKDGLKDAEYRFEHDTKPQFLTEYK